MEAISKSYIKSIIKSDIRFDISIKPTTYMDRAYDSAPKPQRYCFPHPSVGTSNLGTALTLKIIMQHFSSSKVMCVLKFIFCYPFIQIQIKLFANFKRRQSYKKDQMMLIFMEDS